MYEHAFRPLKISRVRSVLLAPFGNTFVSQDSEFNDLLEIKALASGQGGHDKLTRPHTDPE